jgi:hypothetical protein
MVPILPSVASIANSIGAGFVTFVMVKFAKGRAREVHPLMWMVAVLTVGRARRVAWQNGSPGAPRPLPVCAPDRSTATTSCALPVAPVLTLSALPIR